jgi:hypothetical protein
LRHGGRIVALLDQLDLEVAGVRDGRAHREIGMPAAMPEVVGPDPLDVEPGSDAEHVDPVMHGGVDVAHHIPVLGYGSKDAAHLISFA